MGKTDLFRALRRAGRKALAAVRAGVTPEELEDRVRAAVRLARARGPSRRDVLRGSLAGLALAPLAACGDDLRPPGPVIAIIGGGVAGLHAAVQLANAGLASTVYEASGRTGGRMFTQGGFPGGQVAELGGELVDTGHTTIQALATTFGIGLDDLHAEETSLGLRRDTFHFGNKVLAEADLVAAFTPVAMKMDAAVTAAAADDAEFARIDAMSIAQWLQNEAGLPAGNVFRQLLELAYVGEFGLEVAFQSAWNLIYLMDYAHPDPFEIFGTSDETYHLHTGSQAVPDALRATLPASQIQLEHKLVAVSKRVSGRWNVTFDTAGGTVELRADHVIFALPFTMLRQVDLGGAALPADKAQVIAELGYGTNAKLMGAFATRAWRDTHTSGTSITDVGMLQATWDTSRGQPGDTGLLTNFVGGKRGEQFGAGTAEDRMTEILPWVETVFPGTQAKYTSGSAVRQHWPTHPFTMASYACYKPGQTAFSGTEGARVGNLHFCGEHCSQDFQGYMEGGAETGAMAAAEILDDLGIAHPAALTQVLAAKLAVPQGAYHASSGERLFGPRRWLARASRLRR